MRDFHIQNSRSIKNRVSENNHIGHKITLTKTKEPSPCLQR